MRKPSVLSQQRTHRRPSRKRRNGLQSVETFTRGSSEGPRGNSRGFFVVQGSVFFGFSRAISASSTIRIGTISDFVGGSASCRRAALMRSMRAGSHRTCSTSSLRIGGHRFHCSHGGQGTPNPVRPAVPGRNAEPSAASGARIGRCGRRKFRPTSARLERELDALGAFWPVNAKEAKVAEVAALFGADKAKVERGVELVEPFAYTMLLELTAIVAFGYGFSHSRKPPGSALANENRRRPRTATPAGGRRRRISASSGSLGQARQGPRPPRRPGHFPGTPRSTARRYASAGHGQPARFILKAVG